MNIQEKVEELVKLSTELRNEFNELKDSDLQNQLEELEGEDKGLKNEILDFKDALLEQNAKILSLLQDQTDKLVETIEAEKLIPPLLFNRNTTGHVKLFPIKTFKELDDLEAFINDNNINELSSFVQRLLTPGGIVKNIECILSMDCVVQCNLDGIHQKIRLLDYVKFMDLLFQAAYYDGYNRKQFLDEVRRGLRLVKNRHNKNTFRTRQLQRQQQAYEEDEDDDDLHDLEVSAEDLLKGEEILCD